MPIQITARVDGFRPCGMAHSATTRTYPDDRFTAAELATLEREPQLIVTRVSGDAVADGDTAAALAAARERITTLEADALKESNAALTTERDALQAQLAATDTAKAKK
ncbi:MAG: HI1506-related protein [Symbiopectobacterium sp.]|uniref:HI1506-related protein n=1 Tax=Symbiopectobacterium sp. TaxID=2952789 RepID=UPI0039ECEEB3